MELERAGAGTGGRALAASRIALGVAALVSPRLAATPWVGWSSTHPAGDGARPGGRAPATSRWAPAPCSPRGRGAQAERTWVGLAAFCDVVDAVTTVATWRRLPSPGRLLVSAAAAGAAVVGVAAVADTGRSSDLLPASADVLTGVGSVARRGAGTTGARPNPDPTQTKPATATSGVPPPRSCSCACASASATGRPAASRRWKAVISGAVSASGTGSGDATSWLDPRARNIAPRPSSSSPAHTTDRPLSHAASTTVCGASASCSMS